MGFSCHTADAEEESELKILINAMSLKVGGGLVVLVRLLEECLDLHPEHEWHLVANPQVVDLLRKKFPAVHCHVFLWAERSPLHNTIFYLWALNRLAKRLRADVLFSLTNYLPFRPSIPSLLLVQNAGHFSEVFNELHKKTFPAFLPRLAWWAKGRRVVKSVKAATMVTVQTRCLAEAIQRQTGVPGERVSVIPHGPGVCTSGKVKSFPNRDVWRIGYITNYGVQKNFDDLFRAVGLLRQQGHQIKLVLTLGPDDPMNRAVLARAIELGIEGCIENQGNVEVSQVEALYDSLDLFVFPSLCESFGFPMVEAMSRGLPMVVADVPVNREICGSVALAYHPGMEDEMAHQLLMLMSDEQLYQEASRSSLQRSRSLSWRETAKQTCELLLELGMRK